MVRFTGGRWPLDRERVGGDPDLLLTEEGTTFVLQAGDEYKELGRNDLAEMSLASPAVAGDALYIRTESKLYKIAASASAASEHSARH